MATSTVKELTLFLTPAQLFQFSLSPTIKKHGWHDPLAYALSAHFTELDYNFCTQIAEHLNQFKYFSIEDETCRSNQLVSNAFGEEVSKTRGYFNNGSLLQQYNLGLINTETFLCLASFMVLKFTHAHTLPNRDKQITLDDLDNAINQFLKKNKKKLSNIRPPEIKKWFKNYKRKPLPYINFPKLSETKRQLKQVLLDYCSINRNLKTAFADLEKKVKTIKIICVHECNPIQKEYLPRLAAELPNFAIGFFQQSWKNLDDANLSLTLLHQSDYYKNSLLVNCLPRLTISAGSMYPLHYIPSNCSIQLKQILSTLSDIFIQHTREVYLCMPPKNTKEITSSSKDSKQPNLQHDTVKGDKTKPQVNLDIPYQGKKNKPESPFNYKLFILPSFCKEKNKNHSEEPPFPNLSFDKLGPNDQKEIRRLLPFCLQEEITIAPKPS